jgi:endonuclease/exonuclease/phosphatase family metal-dependent hydrolase
MSGRRYTWTNSLPNPMYEKLDRILMSTKWELQHPLSTVLAMSREISDHTPLLLDTGNTSLSHNQPMFKFELGWLL